MQFLHVTTQLGDFLSTKKMQFEEYLLSYPRPPTSRDGPGLPALTCLNSVGETWASQGLISRWAEVVWFYVPTDQTAASLLDELRRWIR